mmetsp:Transcript_19404/g.22321  ORF Transcript_19404/g.22321 Transcript_19404/m.22321 type:complete len:97 (+) Transcript_19404:228-518(+)
MFDMVAKRQYVIVHSFIHAKFKGFFGVQHPLPIPYEDDTDDASGVTVPKGTRQGCFVSSIDQPVDRLIHAMVQNKVTNDVYVSNNDVTLHVEDPVF